MSFRQIDTKKPIPELEEEVLKFWDQEKIFQKSLENRKNSPKFIFYDGPPFANGLPHYGHILAMTIKDTVTRFKTMEGFYVPRRGGWDTHGLPVEFEVEKELGISGKPEIEKYGVEKFNKKAQESVMRYTKEWEKAMARMGRWIDWQNAYTTMDRDYIESVWWVFKQIYDKGLVYQGYKSLPYCPRCGTPLSNFELNQGYKDNVEDPSVYVKFKITNHKFQNTYLLAWTTTPWTLPGNMALAVGEDIDYVQIKFDGESIILAKDRLKEINDKYEIIKELKSKDLIGLEYEPLYDLRENLPASEHGKVIYKIFAASFVSTKDGTGIVHIAPAFGEDDLNLAQEKNLAIVSTVDPAGKIIKNWQIPGEGKFVKDADREIIDDLKNRGLLFKESTIRHTYPFCWRCETPLLYFATTTWFIAVSRLRETLVGNNEQIHWFPAHIKEGRFGKWLAEARDWAVSRNRYWGAPIPIWQCEKCQKNIVVGSITELEKKSGRNIEDEDLHKPFIDEIKINCRCGGEAKRIPEVLDCWFESGSMPYAQQHFPFEHKDEFSKELYPADFIAEGLDQTRGWFYTLHTIASILFDKPAFKNCVVNGIVLAADGKKLSKRLKNYDEPQVIFDKIGVDALRYFLLSSTPMGEDYRFSTEAVQIQLRRVLLPLWNALSFLVTYANVDEWQPRINNKSDNILDQWITSRTNQTANNIKESMDKYDLTRASRNIEELVTDLSQWYVRRSRKRSDKENFYQTLYESLKTIAIVIAPFLPFISENIWQILKSNDDPISVHLCDWPAGQSPPPDRVQTSGRRLGGAQKLLDDMALVRDLAERGLALRAEKKIRVRQPLAQFTIDQDLPKEYQEILKEEINVLKVEIGKEIALDTKITSELKEKGILRDIIRAIQDMRKKSGLNPADKVEIFYQTESKAIINIIEKKNNEIIKETNLTKISKASEELENAYNINGEVLKLKVK